MNTKGITEIGWDKISYDHKFIWSIFLYLLTFVISYFLYINIPILSILLNFIYGFTWLIFLEVQRNLSKYSTNLRKIVFIYSYLLIKLFLMLFIVTIFCSLFAIPFARFILQPTLVESSFIFIFTIATIIVSIYFLICFFRLSRLENKYFKKPLSLYIHLIWKRKYKIYDPIAVLFFEFGSVFLWFIFFGFFINIINFFQDVFFIINKLY